MNPLASPKELEAWLADAKRRIHQQTLDVNRLWRIHGDTSAGLALQGNGTVTYERKTKIGFDATSFGLGAADSFDFITDIADSNFSRLDEVKLLLAGLQANECGDAMLFSSGQWDEIKAWIESGGRMWLNTEWATDEPGDCLEDRTNVNDFLTAIGSAIQYEFGYHDCDEPDWLDATAGSANIVSGLSFKMACAGEISGGTSVWISPDSTTFVAAEQLGLGFIFVSGDGNVWDADIIDTNSELIVRLMEYAAEDVL